MKKCKTCVHWMNDESTTDESTKDGQCTRYPPTPVVIQEPELRMRSITMTIRIDSYFPRTREEIICGEWKGNIPTA